jgi:hypothetical protein
MGSSPMIKNLILVTCLLLTLNSGVFAQGSPELDWLRMAFFHKKAFDKVFFDYDSNNTNPGLSPSGKCAFILPDSVFRTIFPNIFDLIDGSWIDEKMVLTTELIQHEKGTLYATAYASNIEIETWVRFDEITRSNREVKIVFHTTDYSGKSPTKAFKYHKITTVIRRSPRGWRVKKMRVTEIGCCDDRKDFSKGFRRPY